MQLVFILEQVLNGLLVGAYYLLIALGLSLIFALGAVPGPNEDMEIIAPPKDGTCKIG